MEESNSNTINNDQNNFFESLDEFPFYDCIDCSENNLPISQSSSNSLLEPIEESNADALLKSKPRRRRTFSHHDSGRDSKDSSPNSSVSFDINDARVADTGRKFRFLRNERERENSGSDNVQFGSGRNNNRLKGEIKPDSVITDANNEGPDDESDTVHSHVDVVEESSSNFLFSLAGLVIKAIGFQVNLLVRLIAFPV